MNLALNNLQRLICHKTLTMNQLPNHSLKLLLELPLNKFINSVTFNSTKNTNIKGISSWSNG